MTAFGTNILGFGTGGGVIIRDPFTASHVLLVGGAGGGGGDRGGGGGAGGYRLLTCQPFPGAPVVVTIGAGLAGSFSGATNQPAGNTSVELEAGTITAHGGGGGASGFSNPPFGPGFGAPGGSGGGAGSPPSGSTANGGSGNQPPVSPPQGNAGGNTSTIGTFQDSAGGGGAGGKIAGALTGS